MRSHKLLGIVASVVFWLLVWQLASMLVPAKIFLASPIDVSVALWELLGSSEFYGAIGFSFMRVTIGFFGAMLAGVGLALAAYKLSFVEVLFRPFMGLVKAAPVAAFTLITLLLFGPRNQSAIISFLMVLPIFYSNTLASLKSVEPERFEAAAVFGMVNRDRFRFIYLPYAAPFFASSCELGWGVAWKAGVSAEIVAIVAGSVGGMIYDAKINILSAQVMAYTITVVVIALILERLSQWLIRRGEKALTKYGGL